MEIQFPEWENPLFHSLSFLSILWANIWNVTHTKSGCLCGTQSVNTFCSIIPNPTHIHQFFFVVAICARFVFNCCVSSLDEGATLPASNGLIEGGTNCFHPTFSLSPLSLLCPHCVQSAHVATLHKSWRIVTFANGYRKNNKRFEGKENEDSWLRIKIVN